MSVIVLALCIVMITLSGCDVAKNRCPGNVRNVAAGFADPQDSTRTKVWWFHGETETTREGITADLEAYRRAGVGGVVYYDQVHNKKTPGAFEAMSPEWWDMLIFSAREAERLPSSAMCRTAMWPVARGLLPIWECRDLHRPILRSSAAVGWS